MKYLCLCYYDVEALRNLPVDQQAEIGPACAPHDAALQATGNLVVQASLSEPDAWMHFTPEAGQPKAGSGPYLPIKDQVGAFFVMEASSEEEARATASKHATANYGEHLGFAIDVRPCTSYVTYGE